MLFSKAMVYYLWDYINLILFDFMSISFFLLYKIKLAKLKNNFF